MNDGVAGAEKKLVFQSRRRWAALNGFLALASLLTAVPTGTLDWSWRLPIAAVFALNAFGDWRAGVRVDGKGLTLRPAFFIGSLRWAWDEIEGFDHPDSRLGGAPAKGQIQLLLRDPPSFHLPVVSDQPTLLDVLQRHLGPPDPRGAGMEAAT